MFQILGGLSLIGGVTVIGINLGGVIINVNGPLPAVNAAVEKSPVATCSESSKVLETTARGVTIEITRECH